LTNICEKCGSLFSPPRKHKETRFCSPSCAHSRPRNKKPVHLRFWENVVKTDTCWLWVGTVQNTGYGTLNTQGKIVGAHRLAYEILVGPIPNGFSVLHTCDVRRCVNPTHLFVGTQADNILDMTKKHRHPHGETHGKARLDEAAVRVIRQAYSAEPTEKNKRTLGERFGVSWLTIHDVVLLYSWRHVTS
jgi:hypothetical protein